MARRSYRALTTAMAKSPSTSCYAIRGLAVQLRSELKDICASSHYSILQDSIEAIKQFSWQTIILELQEKLPKLMLFLSTLIPKSAKNVPLMCFIASLLLKSHHLRMALVQCAISVMLYGNGTSKQVHTEERIAGLGVHICINIYVGVQQFTFFKYLYVLPPNTEDC